MRAVVAGAVTMAALLVTVAALLSAAVALAAARRVAVALPVLLDLLLAASLLRLTVHPGPGQLAGTALLVLVKRLASSGIRSATAARSAAAAPARLTRLRVQSGQPRSGHAGQVIAATVTLAPDPAAVRQARSFVGQECRSRGLAGDACESAVLMVSEQDGVVRDLTPVRSARLPRR